MWRMSKNGRGGLGRLVSTISIQLDAPSLTYPCLWIFLRLLLTITFLHIVVVFSLSPAIIITVVKLLVVIGVAVQIRKEVILVLADGVDVRCPALA